MAFQELPFAVNVIGGSTSIPVTNVFSIAPPATGTWAVWVDVVTSTAAAAGTVIVSINWNNGVTNAGLDSASISLTTQGEQSSLLGNFYAVNTSPISYNTTVGGVSGSPIYTIRIRFQFLG